MTLPSTGAIGMSDINSEVGRPASTQLAMSWVRDNSKGGIVELSGAYSKTYYQRNVDGNCNNGNCTSNCNCGTNCASGVSNCGFGSAPNCNCSAINCNAVNCSNCLNCNAVNCANCDGKAYLQANCNCACTYNCNIASSVTVNCSSVNCNCSTACDCNCNCDCTNCNSCFPAGTLILKADLTWVPVDLLSIGDMLMGADGKPTKLIQLESPELGGRRMYAMPDGIDGSRTLRWTEEHRFRVRGLDSGVNKWWAANTFEKLHERYHARMGKYMGDYKHVYERALFDDTVSGDGFAFETLPGAYVTPTMRDVTDDMNPYERVYDVVTESGSPVVVEGYIVSGYTPDNFPFTTHQIESQHVLRAIENFPTGKAVHEKAAA